LSEANDQAMAPPRLISGWFVTARLLAVAIRDWFGY
jgi:hypothetical protein